MPRSRPHFWRTKLEGNRLRDRRNVSRLRRQGWRVFTVWECSLAERQLETLYRRLVAASR